MSEPRVRIPGLFTQSGSRAALWTRFFNYKLGLVITACHGRLWALFQWMADGKKWDQEVLR